MRGGVLDLVEGAQFVAQLHVQFVTREGGALPSRGGTVPITRIPIKITVPITSAREGVINVRFLGCQKGPDIVGEIGSPWQVAQMTRFPSASLVTATLNRAF